MVLIQALEQLSNPNLYKTNIGRYVWCKYNSRSQSQLRYVVHPYCDWIENRTPLSSSSSRLFVQRRYLALPAAIDKRVSAMDEKYQQILNSFSSSSSSTSTSSRSMEYKEEVSTLARLSKLYRKLKSLEEEKEAIQDLLEETEANSCKITSTDRNVQDDAALELQEECRAELSRLEQSVQHVGQSIINCLLPKDIDDVSADAILEIRSGAGGDEASLFAAELLSTYQRIASAKGWSCEILATQSTDIGGVREVSLSISSPSGGSGNKHYFISTTEDPYDDSTDPQRQQEQEEDSLLGPYGYFKWESGVHRVQRVPVNDVKLQTSTASVAVLPILTQSTQTVTIPPSDLKVETMRASGAGGQHVNTTESAVRITHIPTGITATIQDERSQHRNRAKALKLIQGRVAQQLKAEEMSKRGDHRRSLMGGGMRSERVRTYNFPQDRITDHRVGITVHGIESRLSSSSSAPATNNSNKATNNNNDVSNSLVATFAHHLRDAWRKELLKELLESDEK
jgi:peptide chain release factor 1